MSIMLFSSKTHTYTNRENRLSVLSNSFSFILSVFLIKKVVSMNVKDKCIKLSEAQFIKMPNRELDFLLKYIHDLLSSFLSIDWHIFTMRSQSA